MVKILLIHIINDKNSTLLENNHFTHKLEKKDEIIITNIGWSNVATGPFKV